MTSKSISATVVLMVLLIGGYFIFNQFSSDLPGWKTYRNGSFRFEFKYPKNKLTIRQDAGSETKLSLSFLPVVNQSANVSSNLSNLGSLTFTAHSSPDIDHATAGQNLGDYMNLIINSDHPENHEFFYSHDLSWFCFTPAAAAASSPDFKIKTCLGEKKEKDIFRLTFHLNKNPADYFSEADMSNLIKSLKINSD